MMAPGGLGTPGPSGIVSMNKMSAHLAGLILVAFSALPFVHINIMAPGEWFLWLFFIAGTAAFGTLFLSIPLWVKAAVIYSLFNSFVSSGPLVSFISYFQLIACIYFFILCLHIKDYSIVFLYVEAFMWFLAFLMLMQIFKQDTLLNFNGSRYFGTVGQHMQMGSFSVILAAVLSLKRRGYLAFPFAASVVCNSAGAFISALAGLIVYCFGRIPRRGIVKILLVGLMIFGVWLIFTGKLEQNLDLHRGRFGIWIKTIEFTGRHWLFGWGIGTYKYLFPALHAIDIVPWKTAHNCWLQILFETGVVGIVIAVGYAYYLMSELIRLLRRAPYKQVAQTCLMTLVLIGVNMLFAFPTRQVQCVPLILFALAYCQGVVNDGKKQT